MPVGDAAPATAIRQGEVTEVFQAWRRQRDEVGEELADVALYLLLLAEMAGVDLEAESSGSCGRTPPGVRA